MDDNHTRALMQRIHETQQDLAGRKVSDTHHTILEGIPESFFDYPSAEVEMSHRFYFAGRVDRCLDSGVDWNETWDQQLHPTSKVFEACENTYHLMSNLSANWYVPAGEIRGLVPELLVPSQELLTRLLCENLAAPSFLLMISDDIHHSDVEPEQNLEEIHPPNKPAAS